MATTSKIKEIGTQREYDYKEKHYRATVLTMENGDKGECSQEKKDVFTIGQELVYNLKPNGEYTPKMYLETPKSGGGKRSGQREDPIEKFIGFSASYAKDLIESGKVELKDFENTADMFLNWMIKKHSQNKQVQAPQTQQTTPVAQTPANPSNITADQLKTLKILWNESAIKDEVMRSFMIEKYKVSSSKDLTYEDTKIFIKKLRDPNWVEEMKKKGTTTDPKPADDDLPF